MSCCSHDSDHGQVIDEHSCWASMATTEPASGNVISLPGHETHNGKNHCCVVLDAFLKTDPYVVPGQIADLRLFGAGMPLHRPDVTLYQPIRYEKNVHHNSMTDLPFCLSGKEFLHFSGQLRLGDPSLS